MTRPVLHICERLTDAGVRPDTDIDGRQKPLRIGRRLLQQQYDGAQASPQNARSMQRTRKSSAVHSDQQSAQDFVLRELQREPAARLDGGENMENETLEVDVSVCVGTYRDDGSLEIPAGVDWSIV
ncbi:hypothetical protein AB4Y38_32490 [Paraburkholderia sp. EG285A]|uniref:hypothetical protein n=1 Tax=Paraburkholderia sp. EG285A TaxID=3237009 RepID=UPI0034D193B8